MRRTFIVLLVAAIGVWGYAVAQFLSGWLGRMAGETPRASADLPPALAAARSLPPLDTAFRDPFQPYLYAQKPAPPPSAASARPAARAVLQVIEPPAAELGGILWGDAPVAILKQDGRTELVKEGAEAFGLKVLRIERHQVTVVKQGRKFVLGY